MALSGKDSGGKSILRDFAALRASHGSSEYSHTSRILYASLFRRNVMWSFVVGSCGDKEPNMG